VRSRRPATFSSVVMARGPMGLGVGGTAVVLTGGAMRTNGTSTLMVFVIWIAIAVVNWISRTGVTTECGWSRDGRRTDHRNLPTVRGRLPYGP